MLASKPTEILVLGTTHLGNLSKKLTPAELEPLLAKLAAFRPDVVTIESVPGHVCELLLAYPSEYPGSADQYCYEVDSFRMESELTMATALAEIRGSLKAWPAQPSAAQRRRLAAAFLAANDSYPAILQWLRLPEAERQIGDGLGAKSINHLTKLAKSSNENTQIGAALAARVGLERVYSADDHSADDITIEADSTFWPHLSTLWSKDVFGLGKEYAQMDSLIYSPNGVLKAYIWMNSARIQQLNTKGDFGTALTDTDKRGIGRSYVAWWQTRNLRMVASIMAAAAKAPEGRVLSIVGSSHKAYFEAYLDQMHDVKLVSAEEVLR